MATDYGTGIGSIPLPGGGLGLDRFFRRVTGPKAVLHAVARRFVTQRGRLAWAPDDGFDLRTLLLESVRDSDIPTYERLIALEAEKDERVLAADCTITVANDTATILLDLTLAEGVFRLVLRASAGTLAIISVG